MSADRPPNGSAPERGERAEWWAPDRPQGVLRATLDAARIGCWESDLATGEAWRSPAHAAIFGYSPAEAQQWSLEAFHSHVHPEDKERVASTIRDGIQQGTGWAFECRIRRKDGSVRWVLVRSTSFPEASTPPNRFCGIVMDITERKVAEMAAQEGNQRFASLANSAPVLIWTSGLDKGCDFFNEPWLAFTGRTLEQEVGTGWVGGVHPEDLQRCLQTYTESFDARVPFKMEYRLRRHDGAYRWILDHGVPRHLPDGTFTGYIGSCIDVTEERLRQQEVLEANRSTQRMVTALQEVMSEQRAILETSPLAIGLVRHRRFVWTNPAHEALLGYSEEEVRGMPTRALYVDELEHARIATEGYAALRRGEILTTEVRLKSKVGASFWCQLIGKAISPDAPDEGSIWLVRDIEADRDTEARLRLQGQMLAHMGEGVVLVSGESGKIVFTNPMFDQMLGYTAGELCGQPVSVLNTPGDLSREEIAANIFAELHQHGRWEGAIENQRKDGTSIWCHASVSRFQHTELGHVWMSVHTDITKAEQMKRALREAKEQYDDLVRHIPCGVQVVRLRPNGSYGFDFVSPRTAELIGVDQKDLYGDATLWTHHAWPEDAARAAKEIARCIATTSPFQWEGRYTVGGVTRWLRFEGHPLAQPNGDVLWSAVVNDITDQKALESAQREAQKLAAIGHMAGGMAHEFNNILASMMMNISLAGHPESRDDPSEMLAELRNGCVRAAGLIRQLLAFSQKSTLKLHQLELADFVTRLLPSVRADLGEGITLDLKSSSSDLAIHGDDELLEQVLRCLCENAGEAMKGAGLIEISLDEIEVTSDRTPPHPEAVSGRFARLSVLDHGCGMDAASRSRLFEPFFTTKEVGRGTGLGLASLLGIIRQHQGWVEVESQVGRGSCFRIHLPLARGHPPSATRTSATSNPKGAASTILLAEDDSGLRSATARLLRRAGYQVLEAPDATAAQALWEAHPEVINLLLSDVVMPRGASGVELARRLAQQRPGLQVILTSGYNTAMEDLPEDLRHRIVYLAKPVQPEVLLGAVRQLLALPGRIPAGSSN